MTLAVPRYVTPRNPNRDSLGHEVVEVLRRLNIVAMDWQADALETMYEVDENGRLFYRECRIATPRQSGKTTLTLGRQVHRMLRSEALGWGDMPVAAFTSQHAADARSMMVNVWAPRVERFLPDDLARFLRSNGKESLEWNSGGRMVTYPPNQVGAHGTTLDLVDIDEAFAFVDDRAEAGARPAQITRPSRQLVIQSTAGTPESVYWREKLEDGRARVEANDSGRVYTLEYAARPDQDIHDPREWATWMPALGATQPLEALQGEHDTMTEDQWARAFCNLWVGSASQVIPAGPWAECFTRKTKREGAVWMAVDVAPSISGLGRSATISSASYRGDEIHVEVLWSQSGTQWVGDALYQLTRETNVESVTVDPVGGIGAILPELKEKANANIETLDVQGMVSACASFHQAVLDRKVRHYHQDMLEEAVTRAARRTLGDGWALKRAGSSGDISPLVSCVLAHWAAVLHPDTGPIKFFSRKETV